MSIVKLKTPLTEKDVKKLKLHGKVLLSGRVFTASDKAHKFLLENFFPKIRNSVIYHCGPLVRKTRNGFEMVSAGPTTSERMSMYVPTIVSKYGIKAFIGKGGFDEDTINNIKGKCVYLQAVGGAGVLYAHKIKVIALHKPEFGFTEAIWELEVKDFPVIVAIDYKGNSIFEEVKRRSSSKR